MKRSEMYDHTLQVLHLHQGGTTAILSTTTAVEARQRPYSLPLLRLEFSLTTFCMSRSPFFLVYEYMVFS